MAFNGQADSQVGLRAGLTRDIWTVINPNLQPLQAEINPGDQVFDQPDDQPDAGAGPQPAQNAGGDPRERARAIAGLAARFVSHPWPVDFR